ncbi:glutamate-1-semialdehyde 2 [Colletotrichum scovillei]|nr:glutamate-1-semialdehyde 2 [Colletotrichum scovillei]KAH8421922.1 glutamate-1-semialdehyde 2 [Colletotrichum scovillei]KAH8422163.1 glutamate-1-semialdehyde 2 [Colletotrichum scovillei]
MGFSNSNGDQPLVSPTTIGKIKQTNEIHSDEIGAIIVEPMQWFGGMRAMPSGFLAFSRNAADTLGLDLR